MSLPSCEWESTTMFDGSMSKCRLEMKNFSGQRGLEKENICTVNMYFENLCKNVGFFSYSKFPKWCDLWKERHAANTVFKVLKTPCRGLITRHDTWEREPQLRSLPFYCVYIHDCI